MERKIPVTITLILFATGLASHAEVHAADMYFSPPAGEYFTGDVIPLDLKLDTSEPVNAVEGIVHYPADKLEAVFVSKTGSVLPLWVEGPSVSNTDGKIRFAAAALNPGFSGLDGKIFSISFAVKAPGLARVSVSSGAALANDGNATDKLANQGSASFSLKNPPPPEPENSASTKTQSAFPPFYITALISLFILLILAIAEYLSRKKKATEAKDDSLP